MASQDPPLDEIQWRSPPAAAAMQGIHSNSVLFYFAESPFFDKTSNNAVLYNQAMFNAAMLRVIQTREAFEGRLKTMSGLEFMVAQEPADMVTGTGVWVIRKQTRRKRAGEEDEVTVHSTYFVVGENVYMAPAVADVIGSRTLSILTSLNKFFSTAATLPTFTPALGTIYLPPASSRPKADSQIPGRFSKENTPLPDSVQPKNQKTEPAVDTLLSSRLLAETLDIHMKYGNEHMDENPITGEPGAFHLSSTGRKEKEAPRVTNKPPPLKMDTSVGNDKKAKDAGGEKSSTKSPGPRRRKSKSKNSLGGVTPS